MRGDDTIPRRRMTDAQRPADSDVRSADGGARDLDPVHELVAACIEALQTDGQAAVDALLARNAAFAKQASERLDRLARAGLLPVPAGDMTQIPERIGDFRLLRRLGSGGMGIVYLAEQMSLGRTVALKLLRPEQRYFPGAQARFRREVETIARLGDPGIVPIHTVGEERGIEWFAMEYVRGASLADVVTALHGVPAARRSGRDFAVAAAARAEVDVPSPLPELFAGTWVDTCCRIVARMARAVHHAHERGVVHRDIKPSNAMITPTGRVLLLDFGLAASVGSSRITRTGAFVGTLHYMAPEQVRDGEADERSDVYALGVTLHELLVLSPPFDADDTEQLRRRIELGESRPLRKGNREIPRDVATIVAVAMDCDRGRRFVSAAALADDLERFLARRPIAARPAGIGLRLRRFAQRHPAAAVAAVCVLVAAAVVPFVVAASRRDADTARIHARANLQSALDAVRGMVQSARSGAMSRAPGLDDVRLQQLAAAAEVMERLRRENGDDPEVALHYVRGMLQVAEVRNLVGQFDRALAALDAVAPVLDAAASTVRGEAIAHERRAAALVRASALVGLGRFDDAAALWQGVVDEMASVDLDRVPDGVLLTLSSCHNNLGRLHHANGDATAAIEHLKASLAIDARLPVAGRSLDRTLDVARSRMNLGTVHRSRGETDAAHACYAAVADELRALARVHADEPELRRELARSEFALAEVAHDRHAFDVAAPLRDGALRAMTALVAAYPARVAYRSELGRMAFTVSNAALIEGDVAAAESAIDLAIREHEVLLEGHAGHPEYGSELATFLQQRAALLARASRVDEALALLDRAVSIQRAIADAHDDPHYRVQLASLLQEIGTIRVRREEWSAARTAFASARDAYEVAVARDHAPAREPRRLPQLLMVLAQVELMCDDFDGVVRALTRLQQVRPLNAAMLREVGTALHVADRADFRALLAAAK